MFGQGFKVSVSDSGLQGLGDFRVQGSRLRGLNKGFKLWAPGVRVWGFGLGSIKLKVEGFRVFRPRPRP